MQTLCPQEETNFLKSIPDFVTLHNHNQLSFLDSDYLHCSTSVAHLKHHISSVQRTLLISAAKQYLQMNCIRKAYLFRTFKDTPHSDYSNRLKIQIQLNKVSTNIRYLNLLLTRIGYHKDSRYISLLKR